METNYKPLKCSLSAMKGADVLQLPADVMQFCIHAADGDRVWCVQADASSLEDFTWKNGNGTNLVHQPLLQVWVLFEYSEHHLLPSDPHASNISQYSA